MPMSGKKMLKLYYAQGWKFLRWGGKRSHVIVGKGTDRETIPMHDELATGTEADLLKHLRKASAQTD